MELRQLANEIAHVPVEDLGALADLTFDEFIEVYGEETQPVKDALQAAGVDVTGICKRKKPPIH